MVTSGRDNCGKAIMGRPGWLLAEDFDFRAGRQLALQRNARDTPGWDRTNGLLLRRQTLYPLSYGRARSHYSIGR